MWILIDNVLTAINVTDVYEVSPHHHDGTWGLRIIYKDIDGKRQEHRIPTGSDKDILSECMRKLIPQLKEVSNVVVTTEFENAVVRSNNG